MTIGQAAIMARFVYRFRNETAHPEDPKLQRIADEMKAAVLKLIRKDLVDEVRLTIDTGIIEK